MTANAITEKSAPVRGKDVYSRFSMPTSSIYKGEWDDSRQIFLGYGVYTYPNGCEYTGYFSNGKFNGYGTLQFPQPTSMTLSGIFANGKLKKLTRMQFNDGLSVKGMRSSSGLQFGLWKYCTRRDRRFYVEHKLGVMPVGPQTHLTANDPPKDLAENTFDAGDGIYLMSKNLLIKGRGPLADIRHIHSSDERQWIEDNCRQKNAADNYMPNEYLKAQIITANMLSEDNWQKYESDCDCGTRSTKEYFARLCQDPQKSSADISVDTILSDFLSDSSALQMIYRHYSHAMKTKSAKKVFLIGDCSEKSLQSVR